MKDLGIFTYIIYSIAHTHKHELWKLFGKLYYCYYYAISFDGNFFVDIGTFENRVKNIKNCQIMLKTELVDLYRDKKI